MMKLSIDISLFVGDTFSIGRVSGHLDLPIVPSVGDAISFLFPLDDKSARCTVMDCNLLLKVEKVIFQPQPSELACVSLMLEDMVFKSAKDAKEVGNYLEHGFSLFFEEN
jgi:hypothetical protein